MTQGVKDRTGSTDRKKRVAFLLMPEIVELLDAARAKLFAAREQRVRPGRDDKILTSWNGLMIKGMARAGRVLDRPDFIASAERALDFIRAQLWRDGRLLEWLRRRLLLACAT